MYVFIFDWDSTLFPSDWLHKNYHQSGTGYRPWLAVCLSLLTSLDQKLVELFTSL